MIFALNHPDLSSMQVLFHATAIIRNLLTEYFQLSAQIHQQSQLQIEIENETVSRHMDGLVDFIRTYWICHSTSP
jgi:hypothetical protein